MALFGKEAREQKARDKEEKKKQEQQEEINQEKEVIDSVEGKYFVKLFSSYSDSKYGVFNMYEEIAKYANLYELKIVTIAKPEDGFVRNGVTVIFEKENDA